MAFTPGRTFLAGFQTGTNLREANTQREALLKEQISQKIAQTQELVTGGLQNLAETVAKIPQRTPKVDNMIQSNMDVLRQTTQMIGQLPGGETVARALQAQLETVGMNIKTASEIQTDQVMLARDKMRQVNNPGQPAAPVGQPSGVSEALPPMPQQQASTPPMAPQMYGQPEAMPAGGPMAAGQDPGVQMAQAQAAPPPGGVGTTSQLADQYALQQELGIEDPRSKGFLEQEGKNSADQRTELSKSLADEIGTAQQMMTLSKDMFTGKTAWWDELTAGVGSALNMNSPDGERMLVNTQRYHQLARKLVGYVIKQYGSGTGLSDADFANALMQAAGDVSFTKEALQGSLKSLIGARIDQINQFNKENPYAQLTIPPEYKAVIEGPGGNPEVPYDMGAVKAIHDEMKANVASGMAPGEAFALAQEQFAGLKQGEPTAAPQEQNVNGIRRYNPETGKIE